MNKKKLIKDKVDRDMEIIKKVILENTKPISIILFGSFSRYEGFVEVKNKKVLPLNDYDLYIIVKKKLGNDFVEKLGEKCSKAIGRGGKEFLEYTGKKYDKNKFFHVDLRELKYDDLRRLLPTQRTFELKNSKVIWGKNVLDIIPDVEVSVSDAIRLLFNKMHHFVFAKNNRKEIKLIYAIKGFTDSASALLIYHNKFVSGYKNRVKEIEKLNLPKEFIKKIKWATDFRFNFSFDKVKDADKLYLDSWKWTQWTLKYIIKEFLDIKENGIKVIAKKMYRKLPYIYFKPYLFLNLFFLQYYLNLKFVLNCWENRKFVVKPLFRWRDSGLILGIAMMLKFFGEDEESRKYLRKIKGGIGDLDKELMQLYGFYYLQKLI